MKKVLKKIGKILGIILLVVMIIAGCVIKFEKLWNPGTQKC